MSGGRISTVKISLINIVNRRFRSTCIVLLIALTTLLITGGTLLGAGLWNSINSIQARLGADVMIYPDGAGANLQDVLLTGEPSTFYLSSDTARRVMELDEIERATQQFFISTFDSAHCVELAQVIGYDPETDFVITPWLQGSKIKQPGYRETVAGANITADTGMVVPLFDVEVKIVGKLDKTGMGFDNSFFVNMETSRMLFDEYLLYPEAQPLPDGLDADSVVSAIFMDLKQGADQTAFQWKLHRDFRNEGVRYAMSQVWVAGMAKNLNIVTVVLFVLLGSIWLISVFALAVIFVLMFNERRREFGILRAIGATGKKLRRIVLCEASLLCAAGALCGTIAACVIVFSFNPLIEHFLKTAYLPPGTFTAFLIITAGFVSGAAAGPLASFFSARTGGRNEALANMREG